jgi:hypothetical protein
MEQDQDKTTEENKEVITEKDGVNLKNLSDQVINEYKDTEPHGREWREAKRTFLKLYINQRKNPKKVGDTLMFSTHQTILASLYKDRLDADWMWREEEDTDRAELLNSLWEFDYDEMGKPDHDYDAYWDASFYGVAFEDWSHFDRESLTPIPDLWDPLATYIDRKATLINGNRLGRGAMRFGGRDIDRTMQEMEELGMFFNLSKLDFDEQKTAEVRQNQEARDRARGMEPGYNTDVKNNKYYPLLQWYTWFNGKRYLVETGNEGTTIVRLTKLKTDYWPLEIKRIYPMSHTLWTPGVADFTEDKQRARAILRNTGLDAAKLDATPMWLFDKNKIKNKQQLQKWKAGKFIEGENLDGNAAFPLSKPTIHQFVDNLMNEMELNAQKALATPDIQQGILFSQKRTATETAEASANVDTRYSLTASLFGNAEANCAYIWYDQYKRHFKDGIDKKTIRVVGAFGPKPEKVTADVFKFKKDPDVKIESRVVSQAKKREQRNNLATYGTLLLQTPGANLRSFAKKVGRLMFTKAEVDQLLPQTIDEMKAEQENESLTNNSLQGVKIEATDDHATHLEIHGKAKDTKAKFAHIEAHKKAMLIQRNNPELFAPFLQPNQPQPIPQQKTPSPQQAVQELVS